MNNDFKMFMVGDNLLTDIDGIYQMKDESTAFG